MMTVLNYLFISCFVLETSILFLISWLMLTNVLLIDLGVLFVTVIIFCFNKGYGEHAELCELYLEMCLMLMIRDLQICGCCSQPLKNTQMAVYTVLLNHFI